MAESTIGIQALSPDAPPPPGKSIRAKISLIWPYSSSTKQCALLLADPDFRLRNDRGQVRVRFTGASATAVAQGKVSIGDELLLELHGATWAAEASNVNTPGKSVEGELVYRGELGLQVVRKAGATEDIDQRIVVNESTPPPEIEQEQPRHETPERNARVTALGAFNLTPIYSSPAFVKRHRLSGGGLFFKREEKVSDSVADIEKELEEEERRPKKKQRISDVRDWKFTNRTPSPEKAHPEVEKEPETRHLDGDNLSEQVAPALAEQSARIDNRSVFGETAWSHAARQTVQQQAENASLNPSRTEASDAQSSAESRLFGFTSQDRSAAAMQPPPLPKLQMPEPFHESSRQVDGTKESRPSTPKLRPVPGYSLPLPSPFPTEAQQSPLGLARPAEPVPTEHEIRQRQQSVETSHETPSDESAVLEINPTIAALARQSQQLQSGQPVVTGDAIDVSQSTDSAGFPTALSQAPRALVQHSIDSETVATPDTEIRDDDEDEDRQSYHFRDTSGVFDQVQSQHPQYLSDTEEDEELEQLYTQAAQREAEQRRLREGVMERDFAQRPRAGFAADADGNPVPRGQALEEDIVHEDEADEVIEDMGEEPQESSDDYDEADDADDADDESELKAGRQSRSSNIEIENRAAESALEEMIDMGTRRMEAPIVIEESGESEVGENEECAQTKPHEPAAQAAPAAMKLPKTPAPPALKDFSFGFDGTSSPPEARPTPQSQKDRTMKKTYGSLFGFRVSPSPEKERQQQQDFQSSDSPSRAPKQPVIETPTPFGYIQRESFDNQITVTDGATRQPTAHIISSSVDQVHVQSPSNDNMEVDKSASVQTQSSAPTDALAEEARSPARGDGDHTVHESLLDAALASSFGTGSALRAEVNTTELHTKQAAGKEQVQRPSVERDSESREETSQQSAEPALSEPRSQSQFVSEPEQHKIKEEPKHQQNPFVGRPRQAGPTPSSAPVRARLSLEVTAPPSSTAPRPSQVEIIDLGSSSDAEVEDESAERLDSRHDPSVTYDDQPIDDKDSDAQSADEHTEVVLTPEAAGLPEPMIMPSETDIPSEDVAGLETLSPAAPFIPETLDNQAWIDSDQGSFFAEQMQAGGLPALESPTRQHSQQPATAASRASGNNIAEENSQVRLQSIHSDFSSFAGDLGQVNASLVSQSTGKASMTGQALVKPTARTSEAKNITEIIEVGSSSPAAASGAPPEDIKMADAGDGVAEICVKESSERAFDEAKRTEEDVIFRIVDSSKQVSFTNNASASGSQRLTRARALKLPQQSSTSDSDHPQVQIAASSFVDETPQLDVDEHQATARSELPITQDESQHRLESQPFQTQIEEAHSSHDMASQHSETQIPTTSFAPPTPEVTNEGLKVVVEDAAEREPTEAEKWTAKGTRRRAESGADSKTPFRRSTRKSQAASQSREDAQDKVNQAAGDRRLSTPDAATRQPSVRASVESDLLSPVKKTPVRRSPRKSAVESEATEKGADLLASFEASPPKKTSTRKSSRKSKAESQLEEEMKRANEESVDEISPPPKKASTAKKQVSQELATGGNVHDEATGEQVKSTPEMAPVRRSFTSRLGQVPEVISAWFSPRRSTRSQAEEKCDQIEVSDAPDDEKGLFRRSSTNGLTTTMSYYYPLAKMEEKLNPSSQPGVDNTVDVIALVTDASSTPERAKSGPKDFFTIFKITDQSLLSGNDADELGEVRVEVYRHWHATLPVASPGDVVLLRGFSVKSRKRRAYLLSGDASAWLVWRFSEVVSQEREIRKRPGSSGGVREEMKGPPVEFAEGERKRGRELREWWVQRQAEGEVDAEAG
ncbi:hypothetical protein AC579_2042 [Pseudocercospora musae]|uniref:Telomeric single stranded DNA binding POT1/Cdc13 domain-containing protein n=1 Tax=Pseudocercospora musae TaxID=113226 RepID=A0A139ICF0_9PEZI|nr:hypothetical protein AC579_2042 [Pseudocercospora musae]